MRNYLNVIHLKECTGLGPEICMLLLIILIVMNIVLQFLITNSLYLRSIQCSYLLNVTLFTQTIPTGYVKGLMSKSSAAALSVPQPVATGCYWRLKQLYLKLIKYHS